MDFMGRGGSEPGFGFDSTLIIPGNELNNIVLTG